MKKEKEYIEPEIIKDDFKKTEKFGGEKINQMEDQMKGIKKAILLRGIASLIVPILIFFLVIAGIVTLIMVLFDKPFDYIISAIFIFVVLKPIYKLIKMFK